jgi:hypothetical protein
MTSRHYICVRNRLVDEFWHRARLESATIASPGRTAARGLCLNGWIFGVCHAEMSFETNAMDQRRLIPMLAAEINSTKVAGSGTAAHNDASEGSAAPLPTFCPKCERHTSAHSLFR